MYSRSQRVISRPNTETAPHVGPGTYSTPITALSPAVTSKVPGHAPFGSLQQRKTVIEDDVLRSDQPPPGAYNVAKELKFAPGGSTMSDRAQRFGRAESLPPPPGTYNVTTRLRGQSAGSGRRPAAATTGRRHRARLHGAVAGGTASIPTRQATTGYVVFEDGSVSKAPAPYDPRGPEHLGAASYNLQRVGENRRSPGLSKSARVLELTAIRTKGPSPSAYEDPRVGRKPRQGGAVGRSRRVVGPPIAHIVETPSPGHYEVIPERKTRPLKSFGVTSTRFDDAKPRGAPVGSYEDPRRSVVVKQDFNPEIADRRPFANSSVRFEAEHPIRYTPGPAAYAVPPIRPRQGAPSLKQTGVRTAPWVGRHEGEKPPPGTYELGRDLFTSKQEGATVFRSQTRRMQHQDPNDAPPPTNFYTGKDMLASDPYAGRKGPFGSRSLRKLPFEQLDHFVPASNTYAPAGPKNNKGKLPDRDTSRFKVRDSGVPGPNAYILQPSVADSVHQGSFNATLTRR